MPVPRIIIKTGPKFRICFMWSPQSVEESPRILEKPLRDGAKESGAALKLTGPPLLREHGVWSVLGCTSLDNRRQYVPVGLAPC